jgi:hypothetical protein
MSSQLRKLKEKIENKNKKPRKAPVFNRDDGPQCDKCLRRFSTTTVAAQPQSSHSRRQDEQGL